VRVLARKKLQLSTHFSIFHWL